MKKNIFFSLTLLFAILSLSGCFEGKFQDQAARNANQYDINPNQNLGEDDLEAAKRLSVNTPRQSESESAPAQPKNNANNNPKQPPAMQIDKNKNYTAVLKTSEGDIEIELDASRTPITANNFVALAKENFYAGTIFHRAIKDFMIQGGDPNGDGSGGPGYKFADENLEGTYARGTVAVANSGPNTNGSQFFIMHQDYPLPNNYVIFGQVTSGLEVVDKIASAPVTMSASGENSKPVNPVKVNSVEIRER